MNPCHRRRCLAVKEKSQFGDEGQGDGYLTQRTLIRDPKIFQIAEEAESRK